MMNKEPLMWVNGEYMPQSQAVVPVLTHGLHYGSAVFEGVRAYGGKIFKLQEHTDRLFASAAMMDMEPRVTPEEINEACRQIIARNNLPDGYLRPLFWRGAEQMGVGALKSKVHAAVAGWDWGNTFHADNCDHGIVLATAKWRRPPPECAPVHAKAAGLYMICTMAKHDAMRQGADDALLLDWRGRISEASAANIFLVLGREIHTPTPDCFLDGITRQTIMQIAADNGHKVVERAILPEELAKADEVFLTGTAYEIMPVCKIDGHSFKVGPVSLELRRLYQDMVRGL